MVEPEKDNKSQDEIPKKCVKTRMGLIVVEVMLVCVVLLALLFGAGAWRLASGPLDLEFIKPAIREALRDSKTGMHVDFEQAVLSWPDLQGPLLLGLKDGRVYDKDDRLVVAIDGAALGLNKAKLLLGQISPEGIILKKPAVLLKRSEGNKFSIALTSRVQGPNIDSGSKQISVDALLDVFGRPGDEVSGRLGALKLVRIEDAKVLIDDMVLSRSWQVSRVDFSLSREEDGMRSRFDIDLPRREKMLEDVYPNVEGDVLVGWDDGSVDVSVVLTDFHVGFLSDKLPELSPLANYDVQLDATVEASLASDFSLKSGEAVLFSNAGALTIPEVKDSPLVYEDFGVKLTYDLDKKQAIMDAFKVKVDGVPFSGQAEAIHEGGSFADDFKANGQLVIDAVTNDQIAGLWPQSLSEDNAKEWVVDKMHAGNISNAKADFSLSGGLRDDNSYAVDVDDIQAAFDFEGLDYKYKSTLDAVKKGSGKGSFDYQSETLRINVASAVIRDLQIPKAELVFANIIEAGKGTAALDIQLNGPLQSLLRYIANEPIGIKVDTDMDAVAGNVDARVKIGFPTTDDIPLEAVSLDVTGKMNNVTLPRVVETLPLSGGPYQVSVKDNVFKLSGSGQLDGRDIALEYEEFVSTKGKNYSSKTKASLIVDEELRTKLGIDLSDFLEGSAAVDVVYTKNLDETAVADVKADITSSFLFLTPFDYEKSRGQAGEATLKAHLKNGNLQKLSELRATAPNLVLKPSVLGFRNKAGKVELSAGKVSDFTVGDTKGAVEFEITETGLLKLAMNGPVLDMRPFLDGGRDKDEPYTAPPMQISVNVNAMRTSDDGTLSRGKIYADINGEGNFNQLELDGVAGAGDVYLRFKPDETGKRVFRLEADDAGAALAAFDVYPNIRGGKMVVYGEPIRGGMDRNLIGKVEISDFKVVDAPSLATLIGSLSLPGAADMLSGEGLNFSKLEAEFDWLFRPEGGLVVLKDGRTSGNSLGLTFEGTYDSAISKVDISGTIIPLSGLNNILQDIPLVGNILGGSTGLFAATYTIKGEGKEPDVSVNPLSVLAPGILRNILFEN